MLDSLVWFLPLLVTHLDKKHFGLKVIVSSFFKFFLIAGLYLYFWTKLYTPKSVCTASLELFVQLLALFDFFFTSLSIFEEVTNFYIVPFAFSRKGG
jgi:hypothetical protein